MPNEPNELYFCERDHRVAFFDELTERYAPDHFSIRRRRRNGRGSTEVCTAASRYQAQRVVDALNLMVTA